MLQLILTKCRLILTLLFGLYKPPKNRLRYNVLQIGVQNVIWWLVSAVVKEMGKGGSKPSSAKGTFTQP